MSHDEYKITYHDASRPEGYQPELHDYMHVDRLGPRVTALVTSGYVVTRIEKVEAP